MIRKFPQGLLFLFAALAVVGLLSTGCTSSSSSEAPSEPSADSSSTSPATSVSETPRSEAPAPSGPPPPSAEEETNRSLSDKLTDTSVETRVERALRQTSSLRVFPFRPHVVNGHLVLRGDVNTPDQYRQVERIARDVEGVEAVTNQLTMGGRAVTEERLSADDSSEGDSAVYHTVQQGDTLWEIAREYRASVDQIRSLNDFGATTLRPGERIRVR